VRWLIIVLVLGAGGWAWSHHAHVADEHALAAVASEIAGRPVGVHCQGFFSELLDINDRAGEVEFPQGRAPDHMFLTRKTCRELKRFRAGHRHTVAADEAINTLTHESFHLRGFTDEAQTQCYAIQTDAWTAVRLGGTTAEGAAVASFILAVQPTLSTEYQSSECRAGGTLDLHPETVAFPTEAQPELRRRASSDRPSRRTRAAELVQPGVRRSRTIAPALAASLLLAVPAADAARGPRASEGLKIRADAHVFAAIYYRPTNPARIDVTRVRISTVDGRFAAAHLSTSNKLIDQPIDVLLWHGVSEWAVITWGTEYLGCGLVRAAVRKDLFGTATCF